MQKGILEEQNVILIGNLLYNYREYLNIGFMPDSIRTNDFLPIGDYRVLINSLK